MKDTLLLITGLLSLAIFSGTSLASSLIEVLFPTVNHVAVASADHYIVGTVDTTQIERLEISNFVEKSDKMDVRPFALAQEFPKMVRRLFGDNYIITEITVRSKFKPGGSEERTKTTDFKAEDRIDLQKFWASKEFQKIYTAAVKDTSAASIYVTLQGYELNLVDFQSEDYKNEFQNFFALRVALNPGSNEIWLRGMDATNRIIEEIPFTYIYKSEIDKKTEIPTSFEEQIFHLPNNEQKCTACHRMSLGGAELTDRTVTSKACYPCHKQLTEKKFLHGPVPTWNCLFCHKDFSGSASRYSPPEDHAVADLCYECHKSLRTDFQSKEYIHGPVASGKCSLCHSPHGSNTPAQLWMPPVELCITCHGDRYKKDHPVLNHPIEGVANPQEPGKHLTCISCHNPHCGETPELYYTANGLYQLCQECHKK